MFFNVQYVHFTLTLVDVKDRLLVCSTVQRFKKKVELSLLKCMYTVEPVLKGPYDERPPFVLRPLDLNILWSFIAYATFDLRPPAFCGHFYNANGVASQDRLSVILCI